MSANYLGVFLRECLGMALTPYEEMVSDYRNRLPVYHNLFYGIETEDGSVLYEKHPYEPPYGYEEELNDYKVAQYYKIFDEKPSSVTH